jgi:hypothetical protein
MNSETENLPEEEGAGEIAENQAVSRDHALTITPQRLAGSIACLNCGTALQGPFCHYCGQPDKNFMRFFPVLLRELLEDFVDWDSRFMRTIKPLLFRPGKLTRDYLDGRRFRYVPPLRLYIFSSIAFFFLAALVTGDMVDIHTDGESSQEEMVDAFKTGETDRPELQEALKELEKVRPGLAEEIAAEVEKSRKAGQTASDEDGDESGLSGEEAPEAGTADEPQRDPDLPDFNFNGEPWDRETNPLILPLVPDWVNEWLNDEIENSPQKGREIEENPDLIKDKMFEVMPATMFVLLPIVALLLKFWYLFAKKYYIEHLIFALHNHSFTFVMILIYLVMISFAEWRDPGGEGWLTETVDWIGIAIWIWIPVYMLLAMKRVYQQGWAMTVLKYSLVGISYLVLLGFATVFVALLSFLLL